MPASTQRLRERAKPCPNSRIGRQQRHHGYDEHRRQTKCPKDCGANQACLLSTARVADRASVFTAPHCRPALVTTPPPRTTRRSGIADDAVARLLPCSGSPRVRKSVLTSPPRWCGAPAHLRWIISCVHRQLRHRCHGARRPVTSLSLCCRSWSERPKWRLAKPGQAVGSSSAVWPLPHCSSWPSSRCRPRHRRSTSLPPLQARPSPHSTS